jgi:ABC-type transport system involved in multi-copper enzyme maturation permease subunit
MTAATLVHARLAWTRLRRGRLLWLCLSLLALPVPVTAAVAASGSWGRGLFDDVLEVYFRFLLPFLAALLGAPALSEELETRTVTYVFARPAPRAALVLGKWLASAAPLGLSAALSVPLVFGLTMLRFPEDAPGQLAHLAAVEVAVLLGAAAFAGLAVLGGVLFRRHAFAAVAGYLLVIELGLGSAPVVLNLATFSWHLRNLADLPHPSAIAFSLTVPAWASLLIIAAGAAICLTLAALVLRDAE